MAPQYSDRLVEHAQNWAQKAGRTYVYRTGQFRKDEWAQSLIRDQGISEGLVGILCTLETCPSFALVPGPKRPQFVSRPRQQRVLYYYFLDPQFGLIHVRLQTWLPFTVQVYVNGHEWLAQQMVQKKLGFVQQHNAFTQLDDPDQAQRLADRFAKLNWPKILDRWARQVNPLLRELLAGYPVHWVVDQAEYATDLLFKSRAALAGLYRALLDYAVRTFTPKDILGFLGRKWDRRFDGEVHTHYEDDRWFGTRIKHRMKSNWLKMYDKFGLILRVETVINSPKEFWVYRTQLASRRHFLGGLLSHDQERGFLGRLSRAGAGLQPPLPGRLGGGRRSGSGLPGTAATHRAQGGRRPQLRRLQSGAARRRAAVSRRSWTATTSPVAFATATSGSRCSGTRKPAAEQRRASAAVGRLLKRLARAPLGGEDPAHTALAGDGTRPTFARHGRAALLQLLARTGSIIDSYHPKTSPHLAEKFSGKNLCHSGLKPRGLPAG